MKNMIETLAVVIDEAVADKNITAFQTYCNTHGLKLRPHIKTHKLPHFAHMQIDAGAHGITCQKIGEAEVMADAGIDDILITFNILGSSKLSRLKTLAERLGRLTVTADNSATIAGLANTFADAEYPLHVMVECDTGAGRCGVQTPEEAVALAEEITEASGLAFAGLMTYPPVGGTLAVTDFMKKAVDKLSAAELSCPAISSGGSPDMWQAHQQSDATEYRIGTYIYNDRSLVERGVCDWADCALTVLATVVSTPTANRSIIDAGSKSLTSDLLGLEGYGHVLNNPEANIVSLSEEHGVLHHNTNNLFKVGDQISIVPNHVCVVSNMFDTVWIQRKSGDLEPFQVTARGKVI